MTRAFVLMFLGLFFCTSVGHSQSAPKIFLRGSVTSKKACQGDIIRGPTCEEQTLPSDKSCEMLTDTSMHSVEPRVMGLRQFGRNESIGQLNSQGITGEVSDKILFATSKTHDLVFVQMKTQGEFKPKSFEVRQDFQILKGGRFKYTSYTCDNLTNVPLAPKKTLATNEPPMNLVLKKKSRIPASTDDPSGQK